MNAKETVLLVLHGYGGRIVGKTMLQKVCYFIDVFSHAKLEFLPHYYGPFSPPVDQAVAELRNLDLIYEERVGFGVASPSGFGELKRYDYRLTEDGKLVVQNLHSKKAEECEEVLAVVRRIREAGNPDYLTLSVAAKSYFVLAKQKQAMTGEQIKIAAKSLGWSLKDEDVDKALRLLQRLDLVTLD